MVFAPFVKRNASMTGLIVIALFVKKNALITGYIGIIVSAQFAKHCAKIISGIMVSAQFAKENATILGIMVDVHFAIMIKIWNKDLVLEESKELSLKESLILIVSAVLEVV